MLLAAMPSWIWTATLVVLIFVLLILAIFFAMSLEDDEIFVWA